LLKKADGDQSRLGLLCVDSSTSTSSLLHFQLGLFGLHGVAAPCPAMAVASDCQSPKVVIRCIALDIQQHGQDTTWTILGASYPFATVTDRGG